MLIKQIQLNPNEATAYFWVNTIKNKVRELSIDKTNKLAEELNFLDIFYNYTDIEWRKIYLELTKYIEYKVKNYIPHGLYGIDEYNQITSKYYHNDINKVLSKIALKKIPDIRLASNDMKDSIIITNKYGANRYYISEGMTPIDNSFETNYILSGDKLELDFERLLMSVIAVIQQNKKSFNSVKQLKKIFCDIYIDIYGNVDRLKLEEQFNIVFDQIHDKGLLLGTSYDKEYLCKFSDIDLVDNVTKDNIVKIKKLNIKL